MTARARSLPFVLLLVLSFAFAISCGGNRQKPAMQIAAKALSKPLVLLTTDGSAEARGVDDKSFHPMKKSAPSPFLLEVRAPNAGAILFVGDVGHRAGKLWLRGSSTVALGEDAAGHVRVALLEGDARYQALDAAQEIDAVVGGSIASIRARDVLLSRRGETVSLVDTHSALEAADWSFALAYEKAPAGIGSLETKVDPPATAAGAAPITKARLTLRTLTVKAKPAGELIETEVDHTFHNDTDARLEGTFRFPLPQGAILIGLAMEMNGKLMDGELVERDKARKTYEAIVDAMQDPALLEWEQGNTFKLRVFPIEPKSDKRVVIRYLAPVRSSVSGNDWVYETSAPEMQQAIDRFTLTFAGKTIVDAKKFVPGNDVVVALGARPSLAAFKEKRGALLYTTVRLRPDWSKIAAPPPPPSGPRKLLLVVDTSRSVLEERALTIDAMKLLLSELHEGDELQVLAFDVEARATKITKVTPAAIEEAVKFVQGYEPDGASDLSLALVEAGKLVASARVADANAPIDVVYIGDGTPTWGETDESALKKLAIESLKTTPFHAVILGKGADESAVRTIAAALSGRVVHPRSKPEVESFGVTLARAREMKKLISVRLSAGDGDTLLLGDAHVGAKEVTLYEGDEITATIQSNATTPPSKLTLTALAYGAEVTQSFGLGGAVDAPHVAKRWAVAHIAALEQAAEGGGAGAKDAIVKASLDHGVMCKHTSFLVLESEEEYAKYQIERKSKLLAQKSDAPKISGGDLESLSGQATMTPDHLQPGDPEVRVPAPANAQQVVVVLPFGETKVATYEASLGAWTVRFLVDKDTADGTYDIVVRITHADGTLEIQKLQYVVDTKKPTVTLAMRHGKEPGTYELTATQVITDAEVGQALPNGEAAGLPLDELKKKYAHVLTDAKRVSVRFPDGQVIDLPGIRLGVFRGTWKPNDTSTFPFKLHVVAVDRALNERAFDTTITTVSP